MADEEDDYKNTFTAGDPKDPSSKKRFPTKPSTWDYVKEAFEPTGTRAQIDAIRKRKSGTT